MGIKKYALVTTMLMSMGTGSFIAAQAYAADANPDDELQEIVVTSIRKSLERSIEVKRQANAIVDVISAEGVGKFPDTNVAESLSHLPGISVDHQFGEGEKISILGTDPALNRILVDGQTIASADWGGNPNDPNSRTFNYSLLSPEIIDQAEVYKSTEARIDEGSLGGTVIIHTRKPLDLDANTLRGSVGYSYNTRSEQGNPRGSLLYSWKNPASTFGVMVAGTYDKEDLSRAGIEFFGYQKGSTITSNPTVTGSGSLANATFPAGINAAYFKQTREREGLQAAVQYEPTDTIDLNLSGLYIHGVYNNFSQSRFIYPAASTNLFNAVTINNGLITSASLGQGAYTELDTNYRKTTVQTARVNLAGTWTPTKDWKVYTDVGYTRAFGGKDPEYLLSFYSSSPYSFSYDGTHTNVTSTDGSSTMDNMATRAAGKQVGGIAAQLNADSEAYGQMDVTHDINWGPITTVQAGVKYTDHMNTVRAYGSRTYSNGSTTLAQLGGSQVPSGLFDGLNASGDWLNFYSISQDAVINYLKGLNTTYYRDFGSEYKVTEQNSAAYTQVNFAGEKYRGNVGVRYVHTADDIKYWEYDNGASNPYGVTQTSRYGRFLPTFNFAYDVADDVILRFGAAKVIARPRYADMAGAFSKDDTQHTASGGNPNLKPYESNNYDVSAEWYFNKDSLVSGEFFFRQISSYIVNTATDMVLQDNTHGGTAVYSVSTPVNYSDANVKGFAAMYQTNIAYGFGVQTNYTYSIADTGTANINMPYLSRHTINFIPYYEQGPIQARVSLGWRSPYFTSIGRLDSRNMVDSYLQLDFSTTYSINEQMQVTFNASNLLDEMYYSYNNTKSAPIGYYKNGSVYSINMSYKM
ncbi:TonB-dependent receptor [Nitrospirillum pindoramense]|uniref:Iron complex outermembrane receptor protein n=1 Tax=Nitrospirillum amazonense TaxID=28077 RepID=A0A560H4H5_9PROT|nr:TonB-dependent receptor [Nitrospirillum amazonense]TWB41061.1 iron complex outermembrane receptor protein [Nitrospirillum amazonense]